MATMAHGDSRSSAVNRADTPRSLVGNYSVTVCTFSPIVLVGNDLVGNLSIYQPTEQPGLYRLIGLGGLGKLFSAAWTFGRDAISQGVHANAYTVNYSDNVQNEYLFMFFSPAQWVRPELDISGASMDLMRLLTAMYERLQNFGINGNNGTNSMHNPGRQDIALGWTNLPIWPGSWFYPAQANFSAMTHFSNLGATAAYRPVMVMFATFYADYMTASPDGQAADGEIAEDSHPWHSSLSRASQDSQRRQDSAPLTDPPPTAIEATETVKRRTLARPNPSVMQRA
jgi:hypothetical protein